MYDPELVLFPEGLDVLEEVPEDYEISEFDEVRTHQSAEIMHDVFSEEVIANWPDLPSETKEAYLDEYSARLAESLGIEPLDVVMEYGMGPNELGYTVGNDGTVHINADYINSGSNLAIVLNTVTHETRHCFQQAAIQNPEQFPDIPQEVIEQWNYEWVNYIDCSYDPEGYFNQAIEIDARNFGEDVYEEYEQMLDF